MYSNKKRFLFLTLALLLSGCSFSTGLVTDTGSGSNGKIGKEEYLLTDTAADGSALDNHYKVITLEKGTFAEEALKQSLNRTVSLNDVPSIHLRIQEEQMRFGAYLKDYMSYVEKGDVIAKIYVERDRIALDEAKLTLSRLKEHYARATELAEEQFRETEEQRQYIYDSYEQRLADIRYRQSRLDWEHECRRYESQITDAEKRVEQLTKVGEVYEVKADRAGFVFYSTHYPDGQPLHSGDYICHIIDPEKIFMFTDKQADQMPYGKWVEFDCRLGKIAGQVANGGQLALYGNLDTDRAVFRLHPDGIPRESLTTLTSVTMNAKLKQIENVIVLPRQAVTEEGDSYYVTVRREDGSLLKQKFIPGGSNVNEFWVLRGLEEGMQIVYK